MKNKNKRGNKSLWILVSIILMIFCYGLFHNIQENNELEDSSGLTTGTITKKYRIMNRGYYVNYNYKVKGQFLEGSESVSNKIKINEVSVGDKFEVKYSINNPNYSELQFNKKIN
ncbi:hypothetical protein AWE51_19595 [Aquimarina aggregata]|uniref:DUF3592 domain-containing protein n=1 Tax=Aquimarina aggregata TaxID=1642818 RepID=A0A162WQL3_9FLAO|nr:hypothetical protein [Aquimarina aggregata]KZS38242.1 hypothetical protein AWE51_19595 [Aquimarina aggregata]